MFIELNAITLTHVLTGVHHVGPNEELDLSSLHRGSVCFVDVQVRKAK